MHTRARPPCRAIWMLRRAIERGAELAALAERIPEPIVACL